MNGLGMLEEVGELARSGQAFALATVVWRQGPSSSKQGSRAIITADGELHGWIGGACAEPVVIREARQVIADGHARLLLLGSPDQFGGAVPEGMTVVPISCQSEGALEIYIEPVLPVPHLVIVGSSPSAVMMAREPCLPDDGPCRQTTVASAKVWPLRASSPIRSSTPRPFISPPPPCTEPQC